MAGDVSTLEFRRYDPDNADGQLETWERATTTTIDGRLVSVFEPSWPSSVFATLLKQTMIGFDYPEIYLGSVLDTARNARRSIFLRVGFSGVPGSTVQRVNDRVQYASNVVNLVVPDFEDPLLAGGPNDYNFTGAARFFYQFFPDRYDTLAFVPVASSLGDFGAFHRNVKNTVSGLGVSQFDDSALYGSAGRLQSVELYTAARALVNASSSHEFAHQWGDAFNWLQIAGITGSGHAPTSHSPLWWSGETLIGAVLTGDRRVKQNGTSFEIERTPLPVSYHPIELYSMGLLGREQVPDTLLFENQSQFSSTTVSRPAVGTVIQGGSRTVRIDDIVRIHGPRVGPAAADWRRALVVVSRDALMSQREMDYWNFFSQRLADRNHTGVLSLEGFASPFVASGRRVEFSTAIDSSVGPTLPETLAIDYPPIGVRDFRDVVLTAPMPTHYAIGESVVVAGRVVATDAVDFTSVLLYFTKFGGRSDEVAGFSSTVSRSGDFTITIRFTPSQAGRYEVGMHLFWPDSGPQYARTYLTPIVVE